MKDIAKHRVSVLNLASPVVNDAAEVPIPVLSDSNGLDSSNTATPTAATMQISNSGAGSSQSQSPLPTISVTKPPAPLPVDLPSPGDFRTPSPTDSRSTSFDADLEQGGKLSLDEVDHPLSGTSVAVKPPPPAANTVRQHSASVSTVKEGTLVQLPTEEEMTPSKPALDLLQEESEPSDVRIAPMDPVASPATERKPLEDPLIPNTSSSSNEAAVETSTSDTLVDEMSTGSSKETIAEVPSADDSGKDVEVAKLNDVKKVDEEVNEEDEEEQDLDTTVRLVGGGGSVGVVSSEPESFVTASAAEASPEHDRSDSASLRSESSAGTFQTADGAANDSNPAAGDGGGEKKVLKKKGKHDKKKSFSAGLKRISQLGNASIASPGRRRTDSKEKVVPPLPAP